MRDTNPQNAPKCLEKRIQRNQTTYQSSRHPIPMLHIHPHTNQPKLSHHNPKPPQSQPPKSHPQHQISKTEVLTGGILPSFLPSFLPYSPPPSLPSIFSRYPNYPPPLQYRPVSSTRSIAQSIAKDPRSKFVVADINVKRQRQSKKREKTW